MRSKELYPAIFSRHAEAYERRLEQIMERGEARGRQRAIDLLEARPGMHVLDLACGPGNLTARLAPLVMPGGEVVGIDLAPGMIERARHRGIAGARFEVMDIEQLAFPDESFDAAVCGHGLQFAPDLARALRETRRVLRPGRPLVATVPLGARNTDVWEHLEKAAARWLPPAPPRPSDSEQTQKTVLDAQAFRSAARSAGFGSARVEVVDEHARWASAEQLVDLATSWWDFAARLEGVGEAQRENFKRDAIETLRRRHPGAIETAAGNHVLYAVA
ncbi:MAG TPA: methyltransferase domain-containing protein [Candidatus Dormibacteraeota bacterium]|nr:methyltransferase domain-containing protein [Candidatus Dormibacteraeota bacterium]